MRLTARAVLRYLVERGVLSCADVVLDEWTVVPRSRRNVNFEVRCERRPGYFVKQSTPSAHGSERTLRREADVGWLASHHIAFDGLRELIPRVLRYDAARGILVSELIADGSPLPIDGAGREQATAAAIGSALSTLHRQLAASRLADGQPDAIPSTRPWLLRALASNPAETRFRRRSLREFLAMVRGDDVLSRGLRTLADRYRYRCLIHGDLKRDNILIRGDGTVRVVDWELAEIGDPAWDIGAVLLILLPDSTACGAFLRAYGEANSDELDRALAATAARALQTAFEYQAAPRPRREAARAWADRARELFLGRPRLRAQLEAWV